MQSLWSTVVKKSPVLYAQSCPTPCNPMDCSLPGSPVHGILQARILEEVAMPFSRGSSQPRDRTQVSCIGRWFLYRLSHQGACRVLWTSLNGKGWSADLLPPTRLPGWWKSGVLPGDRTREVGQELQLFWVLLCKGDHMDKGELKSCPSGHSFIEH